jgi:hypothetical protein
MTCEEADEEEVTAHHLERMLSKKNTPKSSWMGGW